MNYFAFKILIPVIYFSLLTSCASPRKGETQGGRSKAEIYYNQGTHELSAKNYTLALKHLLEAYRLESQDSKIQNNLGMVYFFKKKPVFAIKFIQNAINLDPKNTNARLNLATIFVNQKRFKEARAQYDIVLDDLTYEGQYKTYYNIGVLSLKEKKEAEALNYFKQSLNENKSYCPAHFQLGNIYFKNQRYKESLRAYKKAGTGVCYNNPRPIYQQALSLIELQELHTAKEKLQEVVNRFSLTKFERMAHKKIRYIDKRLNHLQSNPEIIKNSKSQVYSPDF